MVLNEVPPKKGSNQGNKKEANQKEVVCLCVCVGVGGICVGVCEWGGGKWSMGKMVNRVTERQGAKSTEN